MIIGPRRSVKQNEVVLDGSSLALLALSARSIPCLNRESIVQFSLFLRFFLLLLLQLFSALFP